MSGVSRGAGTTARTDFEPWDVADRTVLVRSQKGSERTLGSPLTTEQGNSSGHTGPSADLTDLLQHTNDPYVRKIEAGCWIDVRTVTCGDVPAGPAGLCERHRDQLRGAA